MSTTTKLPELPEWLIKAAEILGEELLRRVVARGIDVLGPIVESEHRPTLERVRTIVEPSLGALEETSDELGRRLTEARAAAVLTEDDDPIPPTRDDPNR